MLRATEFTPISDLIRGRYVQVQIGYRMDTGELGYTFATVCSVFPRFIVLEPPEVWN